MEVQACCAAAGTQHCCVSGGQAACTVAGGQLYAVQAHMQPMVQYTGLDLRQWKAAGWVAEVQMLHGQAESHMNSANRCSTTQQVTSTALAGPQPLTHKIGVGHRKAWIAMTFSRFTPQAHTCLSRQQDAA